MDEETLKEIISWLNNPEVVKYSENRHRFHTVESQRSYMWGMPSQDIYRGIFIGWNLIGTISVHIDCHNAVANMGLMIGDRAYWGKGYGFTVWQQMGDFLFMQKNVRKIEAGCMATNTGMMAICQKYGMVEEGRQDRHFMIDDREIDLVNWGKFDETN